MVKKKFHDECEVGFMRPREVKSKFLVKVALIASLSSLVIMIMILCIIFGWFWGIPSSIKKQSEDIERLQQEIQHTKKKNMVDPFVNQLISVNSSKLSLSRDVCIERPSPGPCTTSSMQRWYYEPASRTCRQFTFGGCGGNGNNFVTLRDCEAACDGVTGGDVRRLCDQRPEAGPCRGQLTRFFYDPDSGACQQFLYGGCAGNRNNFISIEDCSSTCDDKLETRRNIKQRTKAQTCSLLSDHGPCSNDQTRWFYNKYKDKCETFSWGGCLGNMNNFNSKTSCENICRPRMDTTTKVQPELVSKETNNVDHICSLPSSAGSCDDDETHERFFYDILTEECRKFVYSGCGGNLNNFHSLNECANFCGQ